MVRTSRIFSAIVLVAAVVVCGSSARAASPLAAIPIGRSTSYRVTSQSVDANGTHNESHYVKFTHAEQNAFAISVDGAPSQTVYIGSGGSFNVPPQLKSALGPFAEMATLMRGAPRPISQNATWAATVPVPIEGTTDNVTVAMSVTKASSDRATIVGLGNNSTIVRPALREHQVSVNINSTIAIGPAYTLTSAHSQVSIVVHMGVVGARDRHYGSSWTIVPASP
jgi:hypothetical protein